jgi:hypothetical protein
VANKPTTAAARVATPADPAIRDILFIGNPPARPRFELVAYGGFVEGFALFGQRLWPMSAQRRNGHHCRAGTREAAADASPIMIRFENNAAFVYAQALRHLHAKPLECPTQNRGTPA